MIVLEAQKLKKSFNSRGSAITAVQNVSLELQNGEILAFLGTNGAGKTTTIKMIAGLILPDSGWIKIMGHNPYHHSKSLIHIGAVLEGNRNLYWRLTPKENLEYFGVLRGLKPHFARQRANVLLERFNLLHKRRVIVQSLSRGMQQKLAIAVALVHQPKLLLLDEPTLGLDVKSVQEMKSLIRELASSGCAIMITTHQLSIAEELSDRVAIIDKGKTIVQESTTALIRQFSSIKYSILVDAEIDLCRINKLKCLGVEISSNRTIRLAESEKFYQVLKILAPLPIVKVQKDNLPLTDIFLKIVKDNENAQASFK